MSEDARLVDGGGAMEWLMGLLYLFWVVFWLGNSEAKWRDRIMMVLAPPAVVLLLVLGLMIDI